jgi:quinolinate synthase
MKMINLPNLFDALNKDQFEVKVDQETAKKARIPIERMVSIG